MIPLNPQSDFLGGSASTRVTWQNETNETRKRGLSQVKINPDFMRTKDEQAESFKQLWKKEYGEDLTNAQALEYSNNLLGLFRTLIAVDERIRRWNKRLIDEPKGFAVPGRETYNCIICYQRLEGSEGWYDQYGIKCPPCQKAVEDGVVPGSICTERDSWFSADDLKRRYGWHHTTVAKKVRTGELKARHIKNGEHHWLYVFLKEENAHLN